jgi:hypothetical protein
VQSIQQVYDWTRISGWSYPRYKLHAVAGQPGLPYHLVVPLEVVVPPWGMPDIATGWADDT